jgi:pyridoxal phosphate enzyme (YggS family)
MTTEPTTLDERYHAVRERVAAAATKSGRRPQDVLLVAVTKYAEPDDIRRLIELGHIDFGENRVQQLGQRAALVSEWFERLEVLPNTVGAGAGGGKAVMIQGPEGAIGADSIRWHMIGHLQRNKARKVIEHVRLVHSIDSLRIAEELQTIAERKETEIDVLVQVNCSGEESKYGCVVPAAMPLAEQIDSMMNLRVRGLMTMAAPSDDPNDARPAFSLCRELFLDIRKAGIGGDRFNLLSMGMTNDFEVAIEEGANLVRVGSAIFGERDQHADTAGGVETGQSEPNEAEKSGA